MKHGRNIYSLLAAQKVYFVTPARQTNLFFDLSVEKTSFAAREKHLFLTGGSKSSLFCPLRGKQIHFFTPKWERNRMQHERNIYFLLAGQKVHFFYPCEVNKSIFWPPSGKNILCNTGETFNFYCRVKKCTFLPPARQTYLFLGPPVEKNRLQHRRNIYFTRVIAALALFGHQISHLPNRLFLPSCLIYYFTRLISPGDIV